MPTFTDEQKRFILQKEGYDPTKFNLSDGGVVTPITQSTQSVAPTTDTVNPQSSTGPSLLESSARAAAESTIPTVLGGTVAGLSGKLVSAVIPHPIAKVGAQVLGGIGGSLLGAAGQEAVVPDSVKAQLFTRPEDRVAHPIATTVAGAIPQVIFGNPFTGVKNLLTAGKELLSPRALLTGNKVLTDASKQTLQSAALGATINPAVQAGLAVARGETPSIPELLTAAGSGALFNDTYNNRVNRLLGIAPDPRAIASRIPFDPGSTEVPRTAFDSRALQEAALKAQQQAAEAARLEALAAPKRAIEQQIVSPTRQAYLGEQLLNARDRAALEPPRPGPIADTTIPRAGLIEGVTPEQAQAIGDFKSMQATADARARVAGEVDAQNAKLAAEERAAKLQKYIDASPYASDPQARAVFEEILRTHPDPLNDPQTLGLAESQAGEILKHNKLVELANKDQNLRLEETRTAIKEQRIRQEEWQKAAEESLKNREQIAKGKESTAQQQKATEQNLPQPTPNPAETSQANFPLTPPEGVKFSAKIDAEGIKRLEALGLKLINGKWTAVNPKGEPTLPPKLPELNAPKRELTPSEADLARKRGVNLQLEPDLPDYVKGKEYYPGRQVRVNPDAGIETTGHEIAGHTMLQDLLNSSDPKDVEFGKRALDLAARTGQKPEELLADLAGADFKRRVSLAKGSLGEKLKNFWQDFKDYRALKAGEATLEQGARHLTSRAMHDAAFGTRGELVNEKTLPVEGAPGQVKYSISKPEDQPAHKIPREITIPLVRSEISEISKDPKLGTAGPVVAKAFQHMAEAYRRFSGEYRSTSLEDLKNLVGGNSPAAYFTGNSSAAKKVLKYLDAKRDGLPLPSLSPPEARAVSLVQAMFRKVGEERNARPGLRTGSLDDNYVWHGMSQDAKETLINAPNSPKAEQYRRDFIDYVSGVAAKRGESDPVAIATQRWDELKSAFRNTSAGTDISSSFGPLDKAQGYGLPESMRDQNLFTRVSHYTDRVARRFAYHDAIESVPEVQDALFGKDGIAGADKVKYTLQRLTSTSPSKLGAGIEASTSLLNTLLTGLFSGVKDVTTTAILGAQHMPHPLALPRVLVKGLQDFRQNMRESFAKGVNRSQVGTFEGQDYAEEGLSGVIDAVRRLRDISNDVQGRNYLEKIGRTWAYGQGKVLTRDYLAKAQKGNLSAQTVKFLDSFAPEDWRARVRSGTIPDSLVGDIAARYVDSVAGTYDSAGLPRWAHDSHLAPFFRLSRWSIEKSNDFARHVVTPALKDGNWMPLLNQSLIVGLIGGAGMEALQEYFAKRKSNLPTASEIAATAEAGHPLNTAAALAYKVTGLANLSGYGGELMNVVKMVLDKRFGSRPTWYRYPLAQTASDLMDYVPQLASAAAERDVNKFVDILSDLTESQVQTYRVLLRASSDKRQLELLKQSEGRDLRMFRELMDYETPADYASPEVKDYRNYHAGEFKKAENVQDLMDEYPKAINEAMRKPQMEDRIRALRGLRSPDTGTFPSLTDAPMQTSDFMRYLDRTQGPGTSMKRLVEDEKRKAWNRARGSMVPKI